MQITMDGGGVQVAAPMTTPEDETACHRAQAGTLDTQPCIR